MIEKCKTFREYLYSNYAEEIFEQITYSKNNYPGNTEVVPDYEGWEWSELKDKFNYYVSLYDAIKEAGGCETIDSEYQSGEEGARWLKGMVDSGLVAVQTLNKTGPNKGWQTTSAAIDKYFNEVEDDSKAKQAEAKYEHKLKMINQKDTRIDNELNVLETERNAIKTEIEELGTIWKDNAERTFNLFG